MTVASLTSGSCFSLSLIVRHIEKQKRIARTYPGDAKDVLLLEFALARDGHGLDGETQRLGKDVGRFALRGHEGGVVAAFHGAVGADGR